MGRSKKAKGTRSHDQLHVGVRFPGEMAEMANALVEDANAFLRAKGLPESVTVSGMTKAWIGERLTAEYARRGQNVVHVAFDFKEPLASVLRQLLVKANFQRTAAGEEAIGMADMLMNMIVPWAAQAEADTLGSTTVAEKMLGGASAVIRRGRGHA